MRNKEYSRVDRKEIIAFFSAVATLTLGAILYELLFFRQDRIIGINWLLCILLACVVFAIYTLSIALATYSVFPARARFAKTQRGRLLETLGCLLAMFIMQYLIFGLILQSSAYIVTTIGMVVLGIVTKLLCSCFAE